MEFTQDYCHMLRSSGPSEETFISILDGLQLLQQLTTDGYKNTVTVVIWADDKCLHCL